MNINELAYLEVLLEKQPIIATRTAQDLVEQPETVREDYLKHVRSFVIIGKGVSSTDEEQLTIADYESRLLKIVKNDGAAKGYITAEYGYGKTSTAIFIWHRCEQAEIVAVPPFQIQKLDHLLSATYGWVRFKLATSYPHLLPEAEKIYHHYIDHDIAANAKTESDRELLQRLYREGKYNPELQAIDYIKFFEDMTQLVRSAGYNGLVVIADEVQQYLEPNIKSGMYDPLAPLFNIMQVLMIRKGTLPFALLLTIPRKELGVMNDQRSDLVQRLKSDGLALDLSVIYNQTFARDLWQQLAQELQFESVKDKIVLPETLDALGQISARSDLATGPRAVIDVFKLITQRYKEHTGDISPFSPLDLINAFLYNDVHYDNLAKLQEVVNRHLTHQFIRDSLTCQTAIKLIAAFPNDGLPERYFDYYGVRSAIDQILQEAQGDMIILAGGGYDDKGQQRETRALLVGLEAQKANTGWLDASIREFIRHYFESSYRQTVLAMKGFQALLKQLVFKGDNWKLIQSWDYTLTQNRTYFWEGAFPNMTRKNYPNRLLQVQIIGRQEEVRELTKIEADLVLTFRLALNDDQPEVTRRTLPGSISYQDKITTFVLNMSYNSGKENYGDLHATLRPVVSPWKITPTLLLSLYAYLDEKRQAGSMPKAEGEMITAHFQPVLLEHAFEQLFNANLGAEFGAGGIRIVEEVVKRQLEKHYRQYRTLITNSQWRQSLRKYQLALENLPTPYERQGRQLYTNTKKALAADIFRITVPPLENFLNTNALLLKAEGVDKWRFMLHPLEQQVMEQLKESHYTEPPRPSGKPRRKIEHTTALRIAREKGYRNDEFEEALALLKLRGLISLNPSHTWIIAEEMQVPLVSDLRIALHHYKNRLEIVKEILKDNQQIDGWLEAIPKYTQLIEQLAIVPDEQRQTNLDSTIRIRQNDLDGTIHVLRNQLAENIQQRIQEGVTKRVSADMLEQALPEGFFQPQLNTQRISLLKEYGDIGTKRSQMKEQFNRLHALIEKPDFSENDLLHIVKEQKRIRNGIAQIDENIVQFQKKENFYNKACQMLCQAKELQNRLQQVASDIGTVFQKELDEWALGIKGEFSSNKLKALEQYERWQVQLSEIQQHFEQQLQAERERFVKIHTDYKQFVIRQFAHKNLWSDISFNPADPQDSYNRLWNQVHAMLKSALSNVQKDLQAAYDRCARILGSEFQDLSAVERFDIQTQLEQLQHHLSTTINETSIFHHRISEERFIPWIQLEGLVKFAEELLGPMLMQISSLHEWLGDSLDCVAESEQRIASARLSPQDETILAVLTRLTQSTNAAEGIELGLLLQHLTEYQNTSWQDIMCLYFKQRLSIKVAPVIFN
jgi:hypothetical protein